MVYPAHNLSNLIKSFFLTVKVAYFQSSRRTKRDNILITFFLFATKLQNTDTPSWKVIQGEWLFFQEQSLLNMDR